jgi:NAD(P)-dependent dehydrogenase (short-subunit alcohol dehydrogenase family)
MPGKTLVILGSGPGIGIAVAKVFSVRGFTHVALVSRNKERLAQDEDGVLDAIQERGYSCRVKTWVCDISDLKQLNSTLKEIESFGSLECVLFNPARVAGEPPLEESTEAVEADFRVCVLKLQRTSHKTNMNSSRTLVFWRPPNGPFHY